MDSPEEWEDDRCCATCICGELVQDNEEGEMVYCKPLDDYVSTDYFCPGHKYQDLRW